jgi:histidinol-phosphate aminotransferase
MADEVLRALLAARANPALAELRPYVPDPAVVPVRLDANEAPALLPTLEAHERAALHDALAAVEPARSPDVRASALRRALAEKLGVDGERLVLGVGSDEIIAILLQTLGRAVSGPPSILIPTPTFVMYRVSARIHGYVVHEVPLDARWDLDEARISEAIVAHRPAIIFLATPNNPTSGVYDRAVVERIIDLAGRNDPPTAVVIDEAYLPFRLACTPDPWAGVTGLDLAARAPHVVVFRTLSKIGLAALRVGWAVADRALAAEMEKARLPYDLPSYSQAVATCALGPLAPAIERHVAAVAAERARVVSELRALGLDVARPDANFTWLGLGAPRGPAIAAALKAEGILVRSFPAHLDRVRVSFGTRAENDRFLDALRRALGSAR